MNAAKPDQNVETQVNTIAHLAKKTKEGNKEAAHLLYVNTWRSVYFTIIKKTKDAEEAKALLNEVYLRVFAGIGKLKDETAFYAWLINITHCVCVDYMRGMYKANIELLACDDDYDLFEEEDDELIPDVALDKKESREMILKIIEELTETQRDTILYFYYHNLTIREIAKTTNVTENTVYKRLHDAKRMLKTKFTKLRDKGVAFYGMANLHVLRELYQEEALRYAEDSIGAEVWLSVAGRAGKHLAYMALKSAAAKVVAAGTAVTLTAAVASPFITQSAKRTFLPAQTVISIQSDEFHAASTEPVTEEVQLAPPSAEGEAESVALDAESAPPLSEGEAESIAPEVESAPPSVEAEAEAEAITMSVADGIAVVEIEPTVEATAESRVVNPPAVQTVTQTAASDGYYESPGAIGQELPPLATELTRVISFSYEINEGPDVDGLVKDIAAYLGNEFTPNDVTELNADNFDAVNIGVYAVMLTAKVGLASFYVSADVHVTDSIAPVILVEEPRVTFYKGTDISLEEILRKAGVSVTDNSKEVIIPQIYGYESVDFANVGDYALRVNAADSSGNKARQEHVVVRLTDK